MGHTAIWKIVIGEKFSFIHFIRWINLQYTYVSSLVSIEAGIKEAVMAFPQLNNIYDTLLVGISRTIQYSKNHTAKEIRSGNCLTGLIIVKKFSCT